MTSKGLVILSVAKDLREEGFSVQCSGSRDSSSAKVPKVKNRFCCWPPQNDIGVATVILSEAKNLRSEGTVTFY